MIEPSLRVETHRQEPVVVIVDDEVVVTDTIGAFLKLETDYAVHAFQSPVAALEAIERMHVDLVISDFLMPEMTGFEFLSRVRAGHPDVVRVLLTGYADKESAIRAVNEVELYQYLEKPWDNDQLLLVIRNGLKTRRVARQLTDKIDELDRALLAHEKLIERHAALTDQMSLARRVQQMMLPQRFPGPDGLGFAAVYRPALDVGGDYYDVIELAGGRLAAFVADATGHGVQAALSTTLIKSVFTSFTGRDAGAADILSEINAELNRILPVDIFVAATLATIDTASRSVCVANGGGPHPFRIDRDGRVERIASNGLPLGVVDRESYRPGDEVTITVEPGDRVVLYTDGLVEVENARGEEFGETGFVGALGSTRAEPLGTVGKRLVEIAASHASPDHEWDDVTILTAEVPD
jgi:serine phosphatase RsbU (regulator of sigma subunit)